MNVDTFFVSAAIAGLWVLTSFTAALIYNSRQNKKIANAHDQNVPNAYYPPRFSIQGFVAFGGEVGHIRGLEFKGGKLHCNTLTHIKNSYPLGQKLDIEIYGTDSDIVHTLDSHVQTGIMTPGDTLELDIELDFQPRDETRDDRWVLVPEKDSK